MCYLEGEGERQKGSIESETQRMEYPRNVQTTFVQTPFFFFSKPTTNNNNNSSSSSNSPIIPVSPVVALHNLQKSISSAAHNFLHFIHQNPLFSNLLSLSSHFHHFSQVQLRSYRSLNSLSTHNFAAVLPGDSVAGVVVSNGILNFLNLYNTILVVRLVLTWFPNTPPQIVSPLRRGADEVEEEDEAVISFAVVLPLLLLLVLILAIAVSCYLDHRFATFDAYWIHRVGGSSGGIIFILTLLILVLKLKS